jgi:hypothetical protein
MTFNELIAYLHSAPKPASPAASHTSHPRRNYGYACGACCSFHSARKLLVSKARYVMSLMKSRKMHAASKGFIALTIVAAIAGLNAVLARYLRPRPQITCPTISALAGQNSRKS